MLFCGPEIQLCNLKFEFVVMMMMIWCVLWWYACTRDISYETGGWCFDLYIDWWEAGQLKASLVLCPVDGHGRQWNWPSIISVTSIFEEKKKECLRIDAPGFLEMGLLTGVIYSRLFFFFNFVRYWLFTLFTRRCPSYSKYLWGWTYKLLLPCSESCIW